MNILHVSAECYPLAKVGGLADVVGTLPKYQNISNDSSEVIMPFYDNEALNNHKLILILEDEISLGFTKMNFQVLKVDINNGFNIYVVKIPELLDRENVYGYHDDVERFLAFQIAVLDWVKQKEIKPNVIHCHDHHTGLIPFMMSHSFVYSELKGIPTILTIHNAQYQGQFGYDKLYQIPDFKTSVIGLLDWYGQINPLAAAIKCAWRITTVSPSYMEELTVQANGLEGLLKHEKVKAVGILNGIDVNVWDPDKDPLVTYKFNEKNVDIEKAKNKEVLCAQFNLDPNKPLFSFIGRLVYEKGADLFPEAFNEILQDRDISILVLGSGYEGLEDKLMKEHIQNNENYNAYIGYNEGLAHQIYAGSDFLLMPSRVEPCGLNQMYAMRYGTVPVVREIGGLKDTVVDFEDGGIGVCHENVTVSEIIKAIDRAIELYNSNNLFKKIRKKCMSIDHSWDRSAQEYISLYKSLKK